MDRAPFGWVRCRCGFESSPFKSSARRLSVGVYVPASRIDRENAKVNIFKFPNGEVIVPDYARRNSEFLDSPLNSPASLLQLSVSAAS